MELRRARAAMPAVLNIVEADTKTVEVRRCEVIMRRLAVLTCGRAVLGGPGGLLCDRKAKVCGG
jgi:hypothetical protein